MAGKPTTKQAKTKKPARPKSGEGTGKALPPELIKALDTIEGKPTPETYKLSRNMQLQAPRWAGTIFESVEAQETGKYIISKIPRTITEKDIFEFLMGVGQILYNQSQQAGNTDTNSGLLRQVAQGLKSETGNTHYNGTIVATLNELCRYSFGEDEPETVSKKRMKAIIEALHKEPVEISYPNGDKAELTLSAMMGRFYRKKDNSLTYWLTLNPVFCEGAVNNFLELKQDFAKRLKGVVKGRVTTAHYRLATLLAMQKKSNPFIRTIPVLISELGMEADYKKNRKRTEAQLLSICDAMQDLELITRYEPMDGIARGGREALAKIIFYLNPDYPRKSKKRIGDGQQTES